MKSVAHWQGSAVRLLYSPQSGILSVHLLNLQPFNNIENPEADNAESDGMNAVYLQRGLDKMRKIRSV